jgi:hypothetical protein
MDTGRTTGRSDFCSLTGRNPKKHLLHDSRSENPCSNLTVDAGGRRNKATVEVTGTVDTKGDVEAKGVEGRLKASKAEARRRGRREASRGVLGRDEAAYAEAEKGGEGISPNS